MGWDVLELKGGGEAWKNHEHDKMIRICPKEGSWTVIVSSISTGFSREKSFSSKSEAFKSAKKAKQQIK